MVVMLAVVAVIWIIMVKVTKAAGDELVLRMIWKLVDLRYDELKIYDRLLSWLMQTLLVDERD